MVMEMVPVIRRPRHYGAEQAIRYQIEEEASFSLSTCQIIAHAIAYQRADEDFMNEWEDFYGQHLANCRADISCSHFVCQKKMMSESRCTAI